MNKQDKKHLHHRFKELLLPTLKAMIDSEEDHLESLIDAELHIHGFEAPIDRCITECRESIRFLKKRINEYQKYVSELKD